MSQSSRYRPTLRLAGAVLAVSGQNALRSVVAHHILPDWEALAHDYQGVHLSWQGSSRASAT